MNDLIVLTGVHPDESILTKKLLKQFQYELINHFGDSIAIHYLDLDDYLSETTVTNCRYRIYGNFIHDLNRVYRKSVLNEQHIKKAFDSIIYTSTQTPFVSLIEMWFNELINNGIDITELLQGSQTYYNGFLGYTNTLLKEYYSERITGYVRSIRKYLKDQKKVLVLDLHSGIGKSGETTLQYQNFITKPKDSSGYFVEEIAKSLLKFGISEVNVMIIESGVTSTEEYMENVIHEMKKMIITGTTNPSTYITDCVIESYRKNLKINQNIIDEMKDFFDVS